MSIPDKLRDMGYSEDDLESSNPYNPKGIKMNSKELQDLLSNYYGTEMWFRHPLVRECLYTEGVKAFAGAAGAYWLLDIIATELWPRLREEPFININFTVWDGRGRIIAGDGNGNDFWTRDIDYTDCPPGTWEFYLTDNVILLPSEY